MRCNFWEPAVPFNRTAAGVEEIKVRAPCQKGTIHMEARAFINDCRVLQIRNLMPAH